MGTTNNSSDIDGALPTKATPIAADSVLLLDSAANNNMKRVTVANLSAAGGSFFTGIGAVSGNAYYALVAFGNHAPYVGGAAGTLNTIYYFPLQVNVKTSFSSIGIYCYGGAGHNINMGVYNSNASNTAPTGNPIANTTSGSVSTTGAGLKTFTFGSPISLNPGVYWLAMLVDSSTPTYNGLSPNAGGLNVSLGYSTAQTGAVNDAFNNLVTGYSQSATYSTTLPAVGSLTNFTFSTTGSSSHMGHLLYLVAT